MSCLECTDCLSVGTFDICCESVILATPVIHNKYRVVITDVTLGALTSYVNEDPNAIDFSPNQQTYAPGRTYEVRIYPENACDFNDPQKMTNDLHEGEHECFSFELQYIS